MFFNRAKAIQRARPLLNPDEAVAHVIKALEGPNRFLGMGLAMIVAILIALVLQSGLLALPMAIKPMRAITNRTDGPSLNGALAGTGALLGVFSLLVAIGLLLG